MLYRINAILKLSPQHQLIKNIRSWSNLIKVRYNILSLECIYKNGEYPTLKN